MAEYINYFKDLFKVIVSGRSYLNYCILDIERIQKNKTIFLSHTVGLFNKFAKNLLFILWHSLSLRNSHWCAHNKNKQFWITQMRTNKFKKRFIYPSCGLNAFCSIKIIKGWSWFALRGLTKYFLSLATDMTDVTLGASGLWLRTRTGAGGTGILAWRLVGRSLCLHVHKNKN